MLEKNKSFKKEQKYKQQHYFSIRKFKVGVASVTVGSALFFLLGGTASANELPKENIENATTENSSVVSETEETNAPKESIKESPNLRSVNISYKIKYVDEQGKKIKEVTKNITLETTDEVATTVIAEQADYPDFYELVGEKQKNKKITENEDNIIVFTLKNKTKSYKATNTPPEKENNNALSRPENEGESLVRDKTFRDSGANDSSFTPPKEFLDVVEKNNGYYPLAELSSNEDASVLPKAYWDQNSQKLTISAESSNSKEIDRTYWFNMVRDLHNYLHTYEYNYFPYRNYAFSENSNYTIEFSEKVKLPSNSSRLFSNFQRKIIFPNNFNTSNVTDMNYMFSGAELANPDVSNWDTSNVTNMGGMFSGADIANPDVSKWDTSKVTNMGGMFFGADIANPDVSKWDTSKVTNMSGMFAGTQRANPDVSKWDTSNVTNMSKMFSGAKVANPDVSKWDTSKVTDMSNMFLAAKVANPDVSKWDTSKVTDMANMFYEAKVANPDVSKWDTSNVTNMSSMFTRASVANPDVSKWDTSKVTNMDSMFLEAKVANPDVSKWDTSKVTNMDSMFDRATSANPDVSKWDTSKVTNMHSMFDEATSANPDVSKWDTSKVTNMDSIFSDTNFKKLDLSNWKLNEELKLNYFGFISNSDFEEIKLPTFPDSVELWLSDDYFIKTIENGKEKYERKVNKKYLTIPANSSPMEIYKPANTSKVKGLLAYDTQKNGDDNYIYASEDKKTAYETALSLAKDEYLYAKKQAEVDAIFEKLDSAIKALDGKLNKNLVEKQNLKQSIENAIKQAEEAKQEAEKELVKINEDGAVNPEEKAKIEQLNTKITVLKTKANEVLTNALANLAQEEAETYKGRLANVTTVTVPEVTDANSNGIKDIDEIKQSIENAIKQAEEARQEAEKELVKINEDGLVNPEEKAKIEQLNAKITVLKTKATEVLTNALANLAQEEAETYKGRLAKVTTVAVPEVTDANSNGIKDIDEIKQEENKVSNGKGVTHEKPEVHFKNGKGLTHEKPYSNIIENNNSNNGIELIDEQKDKKDQKVVKNTEEKTKKIKEKVNKILPATGIENNSSLLGLIIIYIIAFSYLIRKKIK